MALSAEQLRHCVTCGATLAQREGEYLYDYKRRIACNRLCGNRYANRMLWQKERPTLRERFEEKYIPEPNSGCWLWFGATVPDGYGSFGIKTDKTVKAHRVSWVLYRGDLPATAHVLHRCDNRACVNPDHLFLGDNDANVADRVAKGRSGAVRGSIHPQTKLNETNALAILHDRRSYQQIAEEYGIGSHVVGAIKRGITWRHVTLGLTDRRGTLRGEASGSAKLNANNVAAIRADARSQSAIAGEYGVSQSLISMIKRRRVWTHI